jgi:hypothetical protein
MSSASHGFITPLRVESIDAQNWRILEDFIWVGSQGDEFVVWAGETTDFATVPWWTQSLIPKTGTWTKAAVLHDQMCNDLNRHRKEVKAVHRWISGRMQGFDAGKMPPPPVEPVFSSIDTDAIFRKNAREEGTDVIRAELLWVGVRFGALANAARRGGFVRTAPRLVGDVFVLLALLMGTIALLGWLWPW